MTTTERLPLQESYTRGAWGIVAQLVESLPSMNKVLGLIPALCFNKNKMK